MSAISNIGWISSPVGKLAVPVTNPKPQKNLLDTLFQVTATSWLANLNTRKNFSNSLFYVTVFTLVNFLKIEDINYVG